MKSITNESHGAKKHNGPKDTLAAMRKGNREAEMEKMGGGFRQTKKIHKLKTEKPSKKVDLDKIEKDDMYESATISYTKLMEIISESISNEFSNLAEDDDEEDDFDTGYFVDLDYYDFNDDSIFGDMGYSFGDMWDAKYNTVEDAINSIRTGFHDNNYKEEARDLFRNEEQIAVYTVVRVKNGEIVDRIKSFIPEYFSRFVGLIRTHIDNEIGVL
jgi:hypothetical protein